jgi:hypothetical protein
VVSVISVASLATDAPARHVKPVEVANLRGAASTLRLGGPVNAGSAVIWGQAGQNGSLRIRMSRNRRLTTIFSAAAPQLPEQYRRDPVYDAVLVQELKSLAASESVLSFIRSVVVERTPRCARSTPACAIPGERKLLYADLWVGLPAGTPRLRRISGGPNACAVPLDADVFASRFIAVEDTVSCRGGTPARLVVGAVQRHRITRSVLRRFTKERPVKVALTDGYAAWGSDLAIGPGARPRGDANVVVLSLRRRTITQTVHASSLPSTSALAFDINARGHAAVVFEKPASAACPSRYNVATVARGRIRRLSVRASDLAVGFRANTVVVAFSPGTCGRTARLIAVDPRGRATTIASLGADQFLASFDFDGQWLAYAVTSTSSQVEPAAFRTRIYRQPVPR